MNTSIFIRDEKSPRVTVTLFDDEGPMRGNVCFRTDDGSFDLYLDLTALRLLRSALADKLGPEFVQSVDDVDGTGRDDVSTMKRIIARQSCPALESAPW